MPAWFSNDIEYWKPEQPPPTTPMRRPAGNGSWVAMISWTLATAWGDSVRGIEGVGLRFVTGSATLDMCYLPIKPVMLSLDPDAREDKPEFPTAPQAVDAFPGQPTQS